MGKSRQVEVVEIPTEELAFVPGPHTDRLATVGRWSGAWRAAVVSAPPIVVRALEGRTGRATVTNTGPTFRRLIDVPGTRLALVLRSWWRQAPHDDRNLRLDAPCPVGEAWSLTGEFRRTSMSRWLPVEVLLAPHLGSWTLLELMPRRAIHPNDAYFRSGHRSIDRFVEELRTTHLSLASRSAGRPPARRQ